MSHLCKLIAVGVVCAPLAVAQTLESQLHRPELALAAVHAIAREKQPDLLVGIGVDGSVVTLVLPKKGGEATQTKGALKLPSPDRLLYDFAEIRGDGGAPELVTLSREGILAWSLGEDGSYGGEPLRLDGRRRRSRARFSMRTGQPQPAPICRDVNEDGIADILVPDWMHCELWTRRSADGSPDMAYRRAARLSVVARNERRVGGRRLSDNWESSVEIASLRTQDVNGDGRADILTGQGRYRAWFLQAEDGSFPEEASVELSLETFRDTSPSSSLKPGRVLAGADRQTIRSEDLNGDGIPDYVISHRRKIWVFLGGKEGPQFTKPSQILKSSEDITLLLMLRIDEDDAPDLVSIKVEVPSIGALLLGAVSGLSVELSAVGYQAEAQGTFARKPRWRGRLVLELPSITEVIRDPEGIIRRFEAVGEHVEGFVEGDLDGDSKVDLIQAAVGDEVVRWWKSVGEAGKQPGQEVLRDLLFTEEKRQWNLDDVLDWLGKVVESERIRRTGNRGPDGKVALRPESEAVLEATIAVDLDGDGRTEIVQSWRVPGSPPHLELEVLRWRGAQ